MWEVDLDDVEGWAAGGGGGGVVSPALRSLSTPESLHVSCCSSVTAAPRWEKDDKSQ